MKIFDKEIKPETVTMWVNIIGFVASMVFYCTVETTFVKQVPAENPLQNELIKVDTRLNEEVKQLRQQQDSLLKVIQAHEVKLTHVENQTQKQKVKIISTIRSDWDFLPQKEKDSYVIQLIKHLKQKKP